MDIIFGKLISDELKLTTHRALRSGIQHQHCITPLDPAPGDARRRPFDLRQRPAHRQRAAALHN